MKRGLVVVAASGLAREAIAVELQLRRFDVIRVVDDDPDLWGSTLDGEPIVGGIEVVRELGDHHVLVCAGRGTTRRSIVARLSQLGVTTDRYVSVIHPRVVIPAGCSVGPGSIVLEGTVLTTDVQLGAHVVVMPRVTLTHDVVVEDYATLCAGVSIGGGARVGAAAYIGMNASVRENLRVGMDSTLGMGAALVSDLPRGEVWAGVPARSLTRRQLWEAG